MNVTEKLENFARICQEEAERERMDILKQIDKEVDSAVEIAKKAAQDKADKEISEFKQKAAFRLNRERISARTNVKKELLNEREALADKLFSDIEKRLEKFTESGEYIDYLVKGISEVIKDKERAVVLLTAKDMKKADKIKEKLPTPKVTFEKADEDFIGGFKVMVPDKNIRIDRTFAAKLSESRNNLSVMKIVMREA